MATPVEVGAGGSHGGSDADPAGAAAEGDVVMEEKPARRDTKGDDARNDVTDDDDLSWDSGSTEDSMV